MDCQLLDLPEAGRPLGGLQIFWKEDWLERVAEEGVGDGDARG